MRSTCPPGHKHAATTTCYRTHGCDCAECRTAHNRRNIQRRKLLAYGRSTSGRVPAEHVAEHVGHLMAFGYSYSQIAAAAGISPEPPYRAATGKAKYLQRRVAEAILAVRPTIDDLAPKTIIPARGVHRRVQALACRGWTIKAIADHAGLPRHTLSHWFHHDQITVANHLKVAAVYEQLWNIAPTTTATHQLVGARSTIARAQANGWLPPLAWDDIDADPTPPDPTSDEDHDSEPVIDVIAIDLVVERTETTPLTLEERRIATDRLTRMTDPQTGRPYTAERIAHLVGVDPKTIERDRAHLKALAA